MNDWYNDPPDYPEPPECCGEMMDVTEDGACVCSMCGARIEPAAEYDPGPEPVIELPDDYFAGPERCPHGNEWGECDPCDHLGDLAFDAARERRF